MDPVKTYENRRPTEEEDYRILDHLLAKLQPREKKSFELRTIYDTLEDAQKVGDNNGIMSGYRELDIRTGGFKPSEVIILFGDTGHGKSMLAQNITYRMAKEGNPVLFVGLEMSDEENTVRFKEIARLPYAEIGPLPILYPPKGASLGWQDMRPLIEQAKKEGCVMAVIDHLHAMKLPDASNRQDAIEKMVYEFKSIARDNKIPIVVISHISYRPDTDKPPHIDNLRGSASIGQIADLAIGVYRDPNNFNQDVLTVYIDKRRRGPKGKGFDLTAKDATLTESVLQQVFPGSS